MFVLRIHDKELRWFLFMEVKLVTVPEFLYQKIPHALILTYSTEQERRAYAQKEERSHLGQHRFRRK